MKRALIAVDLQNDFVFGALGSAKAKKMMKKTKIYLEKSRAEGAEIIFTQDTHGEDYLKTREGRRLPVPHGIRGSEGWKLVDGLQKEGDKVFEKTTFGSIELGEYLKEGAFDLVEFIGVCTDICVISNALIVKTFLPEAEITVLQNLCAGSSDKAHKAALEAMKSCQIDVFEAL